VVHTVFSDSQLDKCTGDSGFPKLTIPDTFLLETSWEKTPRDSATALDGQMSSVHAMSRKNTTIRATALDRQCQPDVQRQGRTPYVSSKLIGD